MSELSIDEKVDFSDFPRIDYDGKRFIKELEYQIFVNETWTTTERLWWNYLRNRFLSCVGNYEMEARQAYMKGVEYANSMLDIDIVQDGIYQGDIPDHD